jgi:branched-chain amino acid aminotransferase
VKLEINTVPEIERKAKPTDSSQLGFGTKFSDHMFIMEYREGGWTDARIQPYQDLVLDPAALVLHYGQGIFEGMKAYRKADEIYFFRPEKNLERMNRSATRLVMPNFDVDFVLEAMKELVKIEKDWIPTDKGTALYIRPTMFGNEAILGVRPSNKYLFYIIVGPVGAYYAEGFSPVKIYVADEYVRAVKGGVGDAKTMGNYAASLLAAKQAAEAGYTQVLWLDAKERRYIEEVGTMNLFVKFDDELATSPLTGSILPGVTRESVLHMTRDWGMKVNERMITIDEVIEGIESGKVVEVFGTGTAAVISPVGELYYKGEVHKVGQGRTGELSLKLFEKLTGIQYGETEDPYGWSMKI